MSDGQACLVASRVDEPGRDVVDAPVHAHVAALACVARFGSQWVAFSIAGFLYTTTNRGATWATAAITPPSASTGACAPNLGTQAIASPVQLLYWSRAQVEASLSFGSVLPWS